MGLFGVGQNQVCLGLPGVKLSRTTRSLRKTRMGFSLGQIGVTLCGVKKSQHMGCDSK